MAVLIWNGLRVGKKGVDSLHLSEHFGSSLRKLTEDHEAASQQERWSRGVEEPIGALAHSGTGWQPQLFR